MSDDLEDRLRQALRPVDPGEDFTARVLARVAEPGPRAVPRRLLWAPVALAASLAAAVVIRHEWRERRAMEGLEARKQLIQALRVSSQKLDLAYRIVNSPPPVATGDESGA